MEYTWVDSGVASAQSIMDRDGQLLEELAPDGPIVVHVYEWARPSATVGCLAELAPLLHSQEGLDVARRPTGGGLLFHLFDWAFSILVPSQHPWKQPRRIEDYRWINHHIAVVVNRLLGDTLDFLEGGHQGRPTFCMVQGTKYDGMIGDTKALGAAQRQKQQGFLHQGSLSLALPCPEQLSRWVAPEVASKMVAYTYAPLGRDYAQLPEIRKKLKEALQSYFEELA